MALSDKEISFFRVSALISLVFLLGGIFFLLRPGQPVNAEHMLLFPNSNFERGDLMNWTAEGEAFRNQPTYQDNAFSRRRQKSNVKGNFWVATYENRHTPADVSGAIQGDAPKGKLTSKPFQIKKKNLCFMLGGGNNNDREAVFLEVDGKIALTAFMDGASRGTEEMAEIRWDVAKYMGKTARLIIVDEDVTGWAHINVDDFRYC